MGFIQVYQTWEKKDKKDINILNVYVSVDLLGRTRRCCTLYSSPCPAFVASVRRTRTLFSSPSFTSSGCCRDWLSLYSGGGRFGVLGFFSFGSLHRSLSTYLKLSRIIWYAFGCFGFHFPFALPECTKDFFSLASTQAVDSGCIWITQHSAEASQPSTMAMSMAGCHELMLTWHCTRASFACLMRPSLRLQAERQQAVMFTLLEQCRCAVTWANLNYVPGYLRNPQCVLHS